MSSQAASVPGATHEAVDPITIDVLSLDLATCTRCVGTDQSMCGCGCGDDTACRGWSYQGQRYPDAPVGLIVDAVLGEVYGGTARAERDDELPANPVSFFADRGQAAVDDSACCTPAHQESCCDPAAKADCCGPSAAGGCACS